MILGRRRDSGHTLQQNKFTLNAQQLGNAPAFFIALGSRERFVYCLQSLGNLPGTTKPFCQLAKEPQDAWLGAGLGTLLKSGTQKLRPGVAIAVLRQQDCVEAMAPSSEEGQRMRSGAVEHHRRIAFGCRQVAGEYRDWASSFAQRQTQENRMIKCLGVVDSALRGAPGLLGKSLEPEDPREHDTSHNPLV